MPIPDRLAPGLNPGGLMAALFVNGELADLSDLGDTDTAGIA